MKVCHVTSSPQNGIPRLIRECQTAKSINIEPYIVAQGETFFNDGIHYKGIRKSKNRFYRMFFTSFKLYKESLKIKADIYHIHDPELLMYGLLLKSKERKVIFDSHEFYKIQIQNKEYIPKILRKVISKAYFNFETFICKRLDAVIAVCTVNGEDYFKNRAKKTYLIENFPEVEFFKKVEKKKSLIPSVIYAGSLTPARGITNVIKAAYPTSAKVTLCGIFSPETYYNDLKEMPEFKNVDYKGVLSKKNVIEIMAESWIGVSTLLHKGQYSMIDTLPTKIYEYMSLGIPVIMSDTEYAKKMNAEYNFGICVDPTNVEQISETILHLLNNPNVAISYGKNGKKAVLEKFNWEIEQNKIIDLYEDLLERNFV